MAPVPPPCSQTAVSQSRDSGIESNSWGFKQAMSSRARRGKEPAAGRQSKVRAHIVQCLCTVALQVVRWAFALAPLFAFAGRPLSLQTDMCFHCKRGPHSPMLAWGRKAGECPTYNCPALGAAQRGSAVLGSPPALLLPPSTLCTARSHPLARAPAAHSQTVAPSELRAWTVELLTNTGGDANIYSICQQIPDSESLVA